MKKGISDTASRSLLHKILCIAVRLKAFRKYKLNVFFFSEEKMCFCKSSYLVKESILTYLPKKSGEMMVLNVNSSLKEINLFSVRTLTIPVATKQYPLEAVDWRNPRFGSIKTEILNLDRIGVNELSKMCIDRNFEVELVDLLYRINVDWGSRMYCITHEH